MDHSPSYQANSRPPGLKIVCPKWNVKIHHLIYNTLSLVLGLGQLNPVNNPALVLKSILISLFHLYLQPVSSLHISYIKFCTYFSNPVCMPHVICPIKCELTNYLQAHMIAKFLHVVCSVDFKIQCNISCKYRGQRKIMLLHITMYGLKMHATGSTCLPVDT